jgi:signal peptidase II
MKRKSYYKYILLLALFALGCNADLATKDWAESILKEDIRVNVVPDLVEFVYVENHAVSFGFLGQIPYHIRLPLIYFLTISIGVLFIFITYSFRKRETTYLIPFILILSGAAGNVIDRIQNGYVIDFIHFYYGNEFDFPVFNIADTLIFIGVALLIYRNLKRSVTTLPD